MEKGGELRDCAPLFVSVYMQLVTPKVMAIISSLRSYG